MINTHILFIVIRVVGRHIKIFTRYIIRAKTHGGKSTDKNEINVKLTALNIRDSARYKETLLSKRKRKKKKLIL
jgi:hypothetical protein